MDPSRRWTRPVIRDPSAKPIVGFWHIAVLGNWQHIVHEQYAKLRACGLYDASQTIIVGVIGGRNHEGDLTIPLWEDQKLEAFVTDDVGDYEFPTIARAWREAQQPREPFLAYYFHTKGVSRAGTPSQAPSEAWRAYMEYFNLERWQQCVEILREHDTCGVELHDDHYSGNFWWATSDYLCRLPDADEYWARHRQDRHAAEVYLFTARPRAHCFSDFTEDLYQYTLPPERYRGS